MLNGGLIEGRQTTVWKIGPRAAQAPAFEQDQVQELALTDPSCIIGPVTLWTHVTTTGPVPAHGGSLSISRTTGYVLFPVNSGVALQAQARAAESMAATEPAPAHITDLTSENNSLYFLDNQQPAL
jgi:hypothetical protein